MSIDVTFWGVRGSTACASPPYRKYGGHTSCVSLKCDDALILFDAGTGLYDVGNWVQKEKIKRADLILTHFHLDHVIGLPFFAPLWGAGDFKLTIHFSCQKTHLGQLEHFLKHTLFSPPLFPVFFEKAQKHITLKDYRIGELFSPVPGIRITSGALNHPGGATGYRLDYQGKIVSYITDTEHQPGIADPQVLALMNQADLVIYDATYTEEEFTLKQGWGHSTWQEGVRLARQAEAKKLAFFHHNPAHTDDILERIEQEAQKTWPACFVARQGTTIVLK